MANSTWIGVNDSSWYNSANWSDGIPGDSNAATINSGKITVDGQDINVAGILINGGVVSDLSLG